MKNKSVRFITRAAIIAALYFVLTYVMWVFGSGAIQLRVSEALCVLPLLFPEAVPGLFIGCFLGNILGGAIVIDVVCGSIATLIGAVGGYLLRRNRWLVPIPAIIANMVIVPLVLRYGYGIDMPLLPMALYVGIGEVLSCFVLGELLATLLYRYPKLFQ